MMHFLASLCVHIFAFDKPELLTAQETHKQDCKEDDDSGVANLRNNVQYVTVFKALSHGKQQIKAVVANAHKRKDVRWLDRAGIPFDEVGTCFSGPKDPLCGNRMLGEARPWLQWIVEHYDNLQGQYVAFLHGDQNSWHLADTLSSLRRAAAAMPANVMMLADSTCTWKPSTGKELAAGLYQGNNNGVEKPGLEVIAKVLFGKTFLEAWNSFGMAQNYVCCSEMVVNTDMLKKIDKRIFVALLKMMEKTAGLAWGRIMERSWQNIFSKPFVRSVDEIVSAFEAFSGPPKFVVNSKMNQESKPGDLIDSREESERTHFYDQIMENSQCTPGNMRKRMRTKELNASIKSISRHSM